MSSYPSTSSVNSTSTSQTTSLQAGQVPSYADEHDPSWEEVISMVVIPGQPGQIRDAARSLIRRVRSGDIERPASTWYSKWLIPASRNSCASSADGSRMIMLTSMIQLCASSSESQRGSSTRPSIASQMK